MRTAPQIYYKFRYQKPTNTNIAYPRTNPTTPMMIPTVAICLVVIIPVEAASAFGGVETGRHIARDAEIAIPTIMAGTPPIASKEALSVIAFPTTMRIGTTRSRGSSR